MDDGQVVDFTLEAANLVNRRDKLPPAEPGEVAYLGVEIPADALVKYVHKYQSAELYAHMHYWGAKQRFLL